ncbi:acetyl-CoA C-acetyltransferase [Candidatus Enterovibrio altilux]|uniref:3-ketoacyl-CoA thiolase n=1 Tax=Candidatus Enterovibrio altilux TaxID=1927128 RepID=A0A291B9V2_9GAMM|nr:acetyl-CoA C-acetyltransferase [Candidatus Enterovibrio luxaltus]ATF09763.1 3-ketoacyl-CoA thiolase [Candidatus Enterovibrio luxaltus]
MKKVYIVAAKRTPIGAFIGSLKDTSVGQLAAIAIKGALEASNVSPDAINEVILGNVISAGQGMGIGRQAAIFAGIPLTVPAYAINMVCGSGMKAVMDAVAHIRCDDANIVVAAGAENMSQIPFATSGSLRSGQKMGEIRLKDLLVSDGLTDVYNQYHMGMTAENVAELVGLSRAQQDSYATQSQQKAVAAVENGRFKDEIVPVEIKQRHQTIFFDTDEYPKSDTTQENLNKLSPAFNLEGTVTAGNSSGLNDGASAIIVASESAVQRLGLKPLAEICSYAQVGLDPKIMGLGPVGAVTEALKKAKIFIADVDLFELNEAFAAQALGVIHQLADAHNVSPDTIIEKANVNGGAIALGHPLGASGNRILVSLIHELEKREGTYGVASLCIGGGMGIAMIIKRASTNECNTPLNLITYT